MGKTQKSSSDVMTTGMMVGPNKVRTNQSHKSHDLMTQSNMDVPKNPHLRQSMFEEYDMRKTMVVTRSRIKQRNLNPC